MKCKCVEHQKYEFKFVCEHPRNFGETKIYTFEGLTGWSALKKWRQAIGSFWAITGFRKVGSKRWNNCYVKAWSSEEEFWPYSS